MQYRPDAPTLLRAVADVLDDVLSEVPAAKQDSVRVAARQARLVDGEATLGAVADVLVDVLPDLPTAKQHSVRVAAHLTRLVEREAELGAAAGADELAAIRRLLGTDPTDSSTANRQLAQELRAHEPADTSFDDVVWEVLVGVTRRDLDIAKPGHADWAGR